MLDLAGANSKRQSAERAVSRGMAVAADDGHARLSQAELGANDMNDALFGGAEVKKLQTELQAVVSHRLDLLRRVFIGNRAAAIGGRHVVVHGRESSRRVSDFAAGLAEPFEGLRRGDLVNQVEVYIDEVRLTRFLV